MFETALESRADLLAEIAAQERVVAAARAEQVRLMRRLMRRWADPRVEELAALLDVSTRTARDLVEAAYRTPELSPAMERLSSGEWSFDRAAVTAYLVGAGADPATVASAADHDIAGVVRLRAMQRRITRRSEAEAFEQRGVRVWAPLDQSAGFLSAQLGATDWQTVSAALDDRGDRLPRDRFASASQRRRTGWTAGCPRRWSHGPRRW